MRWYAAGPAQVPAHNPHGLSHTAVSAQQGHLSMHSDIRTQQGSPTVQLVDDIDSWMTLSYKLK